MSGQLQQPEANDISFSACVFSNAHSFHLTNADVVIAPVIEAGVLTLECPANRHEFCMRFATLAATGPLKNSFSQVRTLLLGSKSPS